MSERKRISQREAMRNRRDLRKLRAFVDRIKGPYAWHVDTPVCAIPDSAYTAQRLRDLSWGARTRLVFVAYIEGTSVKIGAVRTPEARDAE
jgi:hypothetical protein